jgi:hypothetical protein
MSEAADERYFRRVEEHFGQRRGGPLVLSPKDWRLLEKWHEKGIPLPVVLRGINHAFDRFRASGPRPDRINSLRYCEQEVQAAWEEHRAAHGRRDADARQPPTAALRGASRHLLAVAAACRATAKERDAATAAPLARAAEALDALGQEAAAGSLDARSIDRRAAELEAQLRRDLATETGVTAETPESPAPEAIDLPRFSPYEV